MLRDLAYPLVEPPHSRPAWKSVFGDYDPLATPWRQKPAFDRSAYTAACSSTSRIVLTLRAIRN
jgi:hypothetical protein